MNYYYTDRSGNTAGPVTREQLQELIDSQLVSTTAKACYEGSQNWEPITAFVRFTVPPKVKPETTHQSRSNPVTPPSSVQSSSITSKAVVPLLAILVALMVIELYFRIEERSQRKEALRQHEEAQQQQQEIIRSVAATSTEIEIKRIDVFSNYIKNLDAYETKSIYHQIYHANNAQLQLINLSIQEQQLIAQILAGKKK